MASACLRDTASGSGTCLKRKAAASEDKCTLCLDGFDLTNNCQFGCGCRFHTDCVIQTLGIARAEKNNGSKVNGGRIGDTNALCPNCRASMLDMRDNLPYGLAKHLMREVDAVKIAIVNTLIKQAQVVDTVTKDGVRLAMGLEPQATFKEVSTKQAVLAIESKTLAFFFCGERRCRKAFCNLKQTCAASIQAEESGSKTACYVCEVKIRTALASKPWSYIPLDAILYCDRCETPCIRDGRRSTGNGTCSHVTCTSCQYEMCYVCGGRYDGWLETNSILPLHMRQQIPFCMRNLTDERTTRGKPRRFGKCMCRSVASGEVRSIDASVEIYLHGPGWEKLAHKFQMVEYVDLL